ncbi:hypothetical protein GCM10025868_46440 [Angustibacter aerolatus]|uniref:Uncharacterized protein n=1 Tax=Angustibacter aerolatus TaxID=1162965 RepID=A0ABQ6JPZ7_9ACTN|nr:hypothetical protein GCM10025868_46440 [Angustibacter aerolatus]
MRWLPKRNVVFGHGYLLGTQPVQGDGADSGSDELALVVSHGAPYFGFAKGADGIRPKVPPSASLVATLERLGSR